MFWNNNRRRPLLPLLPGDITTIATIAEKAASQLDNQPRPGGRTTTTNARGGVLITFSPGSNDFHREKARDALKALGFIVNLISHSEMLAVIGMDPDHPTNMTVTEIDARISDLIELKLIAETQEQNR